MGLLEKASNIEAEEKPPETKVVKPKKEAVKEPPAEKPKKAAKNRRKLSLLKKRNLELQGLRKNCLKVSNLRQKVRDLYEDSSISL